MLFGHFRAKQTTGVAGQTTSECTYLATCTTGMGYATSPNWASPTPKLGRRPQNSTSQPRNASDGTRLHRYECATVRTVSSPQHIYRDTTSLIRTRTKQPYKLRTSGTSAASGSSAYRCGTTLPSCWWHLRPLHPWLRFLCLRKRFSRFLWPWLLRWLWSLWLRVRQLWLRVLRLRLQPR